MSGAADHLGDDPGIADLVEQLRALEEQLRDLAYDRLREAVERGDERVPALQRRLEAARRGVAKAISSLEPRDRAGEPGA